jgi:outer membrane protein, multidrug efflux system
MVVLIATSCTIALERNAANTHGVIPAHWTAAKPSPAHNMDEWVGSFADPALTALVNEALTNNFDLRAAAARVAAAREQTVIAGSGRWPQLGFAAGYVREGSGPGVRNKSIGSSDYSAFDALFTLSWEIESGAVSRLPNKPSNRTQKRCLPIFRAPACLWRHARRKAILN